MIVEERIKEVSKKLQQVYNNSTKESESMKFDNEESTQNIIENVQVFNQIGQKLFNVLLVYLKYDQTIDPCGESCNVQPKQLFHQQNRNIKKDLYMCQVIASILYHTQDEVSTFWIAVSLIENYDMRQFYQKGMPGLTLYGEVLNSLLDLFLPELNEIFRKYEITYVDFFEMWVTSLFTDQIPIDLMVKFISNFIQDGWSFVFRFSLTILKCLQQQISQIDYENNQTNKLPSQFIHKQLKQILNFQEPIDINQFKNISAIENFKNLNESINEGRPSNCLEMADENFNDEENDEKKQFDNNFMIIDENNQHKNKNKLSKIVVNRQKFIKSTAFSGESSILSNSFNQSQKRQNESQKEIQRPIQEGVVGGFFSRIKQMIGIKEQNLQQLEDLKFSAEQLRIKSIIENQIDLEVSDFINEPRECWQYILESVDYDWLIPEKLQVYYMDRQQIQNQFFNTSQDNKDKIQQQIDISVLQASEHNGDYKINRDLVTQILAQKYNISLKKFLDWQRQQILNQQQMLLEFEGDKISEGSQWGKSNTNNIKQRSNVPMQSIVQFDALNNSNNNDQEQKQFKHQNIPVNSRETLQSMDLFRSPIEALNYRSSLQQNNMLGESLNFDNQFIVPRQISNVANNNISSVGISQVQGLNGQFYPNIFNDTDVSMMDEMNRLLVGFKVEQNSSKQRLSFKAKFNHQRQSSNVPGQQQDATLMIVNQQNLQKQQQDLQLQNNLSGAQNVQPLPAQKPESKTNKHQVQFMPQTRKQKYFGNNDLEQENNHKSPLPLEKQHFQQNILQNKINHTEYKQQVNKNQIQAAAFQLPDQPAQKQKEKPLTTVQITPMKLLNNLFSDQQNRNEYANKKRNRENQQNIQNNREATPIQNRNLQISVKKNQVLQINKANEQQNQIYQESDNLQNDKNVRSSLQYSKQMFQTPQNVQTVKDYRVVSKFDEVQVSQQELNPQQENQKQLLSQKYFQKVNLQANEKNRDVTPLQNNTMNSQKLKDVLGSCRNSNKFEMSNCYYPNFIVQSQEKPIDNNNPYKSSDLPNNQMYNKIQLQFQQQNDQNQFQLSTEQNKGIFEMQNIQFQNQEIQYSIQPPIHKFYQQVKAMNAISEFQNQENQKLIDNQFHERVFSFSNQDYQNQINNDLYSNYQYVSSPSKIKFQDRKSSPVKKQFQSPSSELLVNQQNSGESAIASGNFKQESVNSQNNSLSLKQIAINEKFLKIQEMKKNIKIKQQPDQVCDISNKIAIKQNNNIQIEPANALNNNSSSLMAIRLNEQSNQCLLSSPKSQKDDLIIGPNNQELCTYTSDNLQEIKNKNNRPSTNLIYNQQKNIVKNNFNESSKLTNGTSITHGIEGDSKNQIQTSGALLLDYKKINSTNKKRKTLEQNDVRNLEFNEEDDDEEVQFYINQQNEQRKSQSAHKSEKKNNQRRNSRSNPNCFSDDEEFKQDMKQMIIQEQVNQIKFDELDPAPVSQIGYKLELQIEQELQKLFNQNIQVDQKNSESNQQINQLLNAFKIEYEGPGQLDTEQFQPRGSGNDFGNIYDFQSPTKLAQRISNKNIQEDLGDQQNKIQLIKEAIIPRNSGNKQNSGSKQRSVSVCGSIGTQFEFSQNQELDQKQKRLKAVQEFISNAKKNKFSEWRRQKVQNQTLSSEGQSLQQ